MSTGELIAGIAGLVLLIDLWFKWYGVEVNAGGALNNFNIGASATAWQSFGLIDIILFLVALIAIGVAVMRALNRMPDMPYPPATLLTIAGGIALLLILYRTINTPVDTGDVENIDVTRKIGLWIGLLSAAALTYGGWRAMQESGASFGDLSSGRSGGTPAASPTAPTQQAPAAGAGAAAPPPSKEGPGAPHPGTSTGAPDQSGGGAPPAGGADPVPGSTAGTTTPGLAGEPPAEGGTTPPGIAGDPNPDRPA